MLVKLDFHCHRVKSLCFHPYRHWLLCGLHTGVIYVIDYRLDSVVDAYIEHEGSVRAVDFHRTQPLFVSGADDFLIKVWNYNLHRCLFTLSGHTDYIRTTFFHPEQPWIVSASDDYTVRLWNWQNRSCMATLPGHNHFVMCAKFLPQDSQLISCSLDKTIRVWDISTIQDQATDDFGLAEFLGSADVAVVHEVQAHEKGVNWIDCHPTQNFIASCADDFTVRLWKLSGKSFLPYGRAIGHTQNVCCVTFFKNFLISNSEDQSIRVWSVGPSCVSSPVFVQGHHRNADRYWMLAKDEQRNLIAAGHDTGVEILKLARERPAFAFDTNGRSETVYYTFNGNVRAFRFASNTAQEFDVRDNIKKPFRLHVLNDGRLLISSDEEGGMNACGLRVTENTSAVTDLQQLPAPAFLSPTAPDKMVGVAKNELIIFSYEGRQWKTTKKLTTPFAPSRTFPSTPGTVLCYADNKVYLYHLAQQSVTAEVTAPGVKYATWDKKMQRVALLSKNAIIVANRSLKVVTAIQESAVRIKSAVFDETREILYFSTSYHLKYCNLVNGEVSTICAIRNAIYLIKAHGDKIWYISRSGDVNMKELDNTELIFKQKLNQKAYREVIQILSRGKLKGQALVGYLHKHNHSEVALQFVKDPLTRFYLALKCGVIEIAKEMAIELDDASTWKKLAEAALLFGDIQLAQMASTKAEDYRNAAFLSLITGNTSAMGHLVDVTPDEHFRMQYGLHLDDARQRIRVLVDAGQLTLAYLTAKSYQLDDLAEVISSSLEPAVLERLNKVPCHAPPSPKPAAPVTENWPMLRIDESVFSRLLKDPNAAQFHMDAEMDLAEAGDAWGDDDDLAHQHAGDDERMPGDMDEDAQEEGAADAGEGWGDDEELDIDVTATLSKAKISGQKRAYVAPAVHAPPSQPWSSSAEPAVLVAAGMFDLALERLHKQISLCNAAPLHPLMLQLWSSVNVARPSWKVPSAVFTLAAPGSEDDGMKTVPLLPNIVGWMENKLKQGYQLFVTAKFVDSLRCFQVILQQAVFTMPKDDHERHAIRDLIGRASEYARALTLQLQMKSEDPNSPRALALALYFTHFRLLPTHMVLVLSQAMTKSYKKKNYRTAAAVARRLLDQEPPKAKADQATAIIFDAENKEDTVEVDYNGLNPFKLCCVSLTPMYKGTVAPISCPHCGAPALPEYRGNTCPVCQLSALGTEGIGLWNEA